MRTVEVTERDIRVGVRGDCKACPVSRAVGRLVRRGVHPWSSIGLVEFFSRDGLIGRSRLPHRAAMFISRFDTGTKRPSLRPFTFRLNIPAKAVKP